jgi:seryl-tRNA synthetase
MGLGMSDLRERQAVDALGAPPGDAVGDTSPEGRIAELEAQLAAERAARVEAEASADEMALLIERVRGELDAQREAQAGAEATAREIAGLVAQQHERTRRLEEDLRAARAQVPMVDQQQIRAAHKRRAGRRVRRALGR